MKKLLVMVGILGLGAFFVACDNGKTELQFTNSDLSSDNINTIVWEADGTTWNKTGGYARTEDTESKEVSSTSTAGTVICQLPPTDSSSNWVNANVYFPETTNKSLSIKSGSSNKYTLEATY